MDFRLKNTAFRLMQALLFSDTAHYAMQKYAAAFYARHADALALTAPDASALPRCKA